MPSYSTMSDAFSGQSLGQSVAVENVSATNEQLFFGWNRHAAEKLLHCISAAGAALVSDSTSMLSASRMAGICASALRSTPVPADGFFQGWPRDAAFKLILQVKSGLH